ncbi:ABC transporter ATP-binding protein [Nitratireductor thuwali]|uniref:Trehalose import ATP-binding protein SugC n=1 Tax=Nitratireductor thuwali TaxID=2267699 RepID=A0ABY5MRM5_9HYPH|nr:Trehalose import ATP-binding protein SugC [Nitratireductor thuwali]
MTSTAQIEFENVQKHYGQFHALKDINLRIDKGKFVALVGPSGCGKSTLLRSLAGLESISSGTLRIAGEKMNDVPPRRRDIAMVFQSYALYPHMTVRDNLTYSMRLKGVPKNGREKAAREVAAITGLGDLLDRYPRQLSGGQRQRVAMGRAIIRHPKAFLFDEPLSNLDAALRVQMRKEIRALHDRLGATSVYVTHDQVEAMTMADHVVVMRNGVIEQQGAPLQLYDRPANRFVAGFIGSPAMNFVEAAVTASGDALALDGFDGALVPVARRLEPGRKVLAGLRPEHLALGDPDKSPIRVPVSTVEFTGAASYLSSSTEPELTIFHAGRTEVRPGDSVGLSIAPDFVHLFDPGTGQGVD